MRETCETLVQSDKRTSEPAVCSQADKCGALANWCAKQQ